MRAGELTEEEALIVRNNRDWISVCAGMTAEEILKQYRQSSCPSYPLWDAEIGWN